MPVSWRRFLWVAFPALLLGCARSTPPVGTSTALGVPGPTPDEPGTGLPPNPPPPGIAVIDRDVARAIHRLLANDPKLAPVSHHVKVSVHRGVVTLKGSVPSQEARTRLLESVNKMPGVDRIEDHLEPATSP